MNASNLEAQRWFRQAKADMTVVQTLISAGHYAATCFHSQQAAEKALKALLHSQRHRVVLEHSVRALVRRCEAYDTSFTSLMDEAGLLDQFYIPTRYPNGLPAPAIPDESYTEAQAQTAQAAAEHVISVVETFLKANTQALS